MGGGGATCTVIAPEKCPLRKERGHPSQTTTQVSSTALPFNFVEGRGVTVIRSFTKIFLQHQIFNKRQSFIAFHNGKIQVGRKNRNQKTIEIVLN